MTCPAVVQAASPLLLPLYTCWGFSLAFLTPVLPFCPPGAETLAKHSESEPGSRCGYSALVQNILKTYLLIGTFVQRQI